MNLDIFIDKQERFQNLRKRDLKKSPNLKKTFNLINQHLYAKLKYTDTDTRARSREIVNLLLCKLVDEIEKSPDDYVEFCIRDGESIEESFNRIQSLFNKNVKKRYKDIFPNDERISLNPELVYLIVGELQNISLLLSSKDILSDAFEVFVSKILKEEGGQFFTPPNVTKFMINYLAPEIESKIIDPACGHGGFLLETKDLLWSKIENKFGNQDELIEKKKKEIIPSLHGIDKDLFLAKLCKLYLEILSGSIW